MDTVLHFLARPPLDTYVLVPSGFIDCDETLPRHGGCLVGFLKNVSDRFSGECRVEAIDCFSQSAR